MKESRESLGDSPQIGYRSAEFNEWLDAQLRVNDGYIDSERLRYDESARTSDGREQVKRFYAFMDDIFEFADDNYLFVQPEGKAFPTSLAYVQRDDVVYEAGIVRGQGIAVWLKKAVTVIDVTKIVDIATVLDGQKTERAQRIDEQLSEFSARAREQADALLYLGVPRSAITRELSRIAIAMGVFEGNEVFEHANVTDKTEEPTSKQSYWRPENGGLAWLVLNALNQEPDLNSGALASKLGVHKSQISRVGRKLANGGYITKQRAGRTVLWNTTELGVTSIQSTTGQATSG